MDGEGSGCREGGEAEDEVIGKRNFMVSGLIHNLTYRSMDGVTPPPPHHYILRRKPALSTYLSFFIINPIYSSFRTHYSNMLAQTEAGKELLYQNLLGSAVNILESES
jgi:hypothetical protein